MRIRLVLRVLPLVVMPTAVLSLTAARVLKDWELVLERRLETNAAAAIRSVARRLDALLERTLRDVAAGMTRDTAAGGTPASLEAAAGGVRTSCGLAHRVFLFMNPWGFLYPPEDNAEGGGEDPLGGLKTALRGEMAGALGRRPEVRVAVDRAAYCFTALPGENDVYAGFEVDAGAFRTALADALRQFSKEGLTLAADGPGVAGEAGADGDARAVVIESPLGRPSEVAGRVAGARLLAEGRLFAPYGFVRIRAFLANPREMRAAGSLQARLFGWGIVLLFTGIVAGAGVVLRQAAAEIARARSRSDFVMGLSHDLRTPVATLKMLAESLFLGTIPDPAKQKQFLGAMVRECERLNRLVDRVLFLVRFGQRALVYSLKDTDVEFLVSAAVDVFRSQILGMADREHGFRFNVAVARDLPAVRGDGSALTQVMLNLLDNAVKYGRQAGDGPAKADTIDVAACRVVRRRRLGRRRGWVAISVRDHGNGIPRRELRRIFREFYRAPDAGERNVSGVGLGLALCRHVAAAHGGWIEAESKVGRGAVFTMYLPAGGQESGVRSQETGVRSQETGVRSQETGVRGDQPGGRE